MQEKRESKPEDEEVLLQLGKGEETESRNLISLMKNDYDNSSSNSMPDLNQTCATIEKLLSNDKILCMEMQG